MKALVSVLMPAFNCEAYIADTLRSVINQSWQNFEVIVIDDGSSDRTYEIAKSFESSKIKVIRQENVGQSATENRAFAESQGDYIEYLDADDLLSPNKFESQIRLLEQSPPDCVATCPWARFFGDPQEAVFSPLKNWGDFPAVDWLVCTWRDNLMMHGASWLIPREICEKAGPWNEELSLINDFDYFSRILLASNGIQFCKEARTYYRSFERAAARNLSSLKSLEGLQSAFRSISLGTSHLLSAEDSARTREACARVFQQFIYSHYPHAPELLAQAEQRVRELGGCDLTPPGGIKFKLVSELFGWKFAKRMQNLWNS